jgi:hypothetical protein
MSHTSLAVVVDEYASLAQLYGISLPLLSQPIVLAGDDEGLRQVTQVIGEWRRGVRLGVVLLAVQILLAEPFHILKAWRVIGSHVQGGVHQELKDNRWAFPIPGHQAYGRCQICARAVSGNGKTVPVGIQVLRMVGCPDSGRIGIVQCSGELVLWR